MGDSTIQVGERKMTTFLVVTVLFVVVSRSPCWVTGFSAYSSSLIKRTSFHRIHLVRLEESTQQQSPREASNRKRSKKKNDVSFPEDVIQSLQQENEDMRMELDQYRQENERLRQQQQQQQKWENDEDRLSVVEPSLSFLDAVKDRGSWLVGLLVLQSCSGFILSHNEDLLAHHPTIIYFLTMLVGAGGNAGNQASVRGS